MPEQIRRILPLVALELPRLARRQHRDDAVPVVGLELLGRVDDDEAQRAVRVDAREEARDVEDVGGGARGAGEGGVRGDVGPGFEEGFDVRHAQEGGGGGGKQDDGVGAAGGLFGVGGEGGGLGGGVGGGGGSSCAGWGCSSAGEEDLGGFADVGEVLRATVSLWVFKRGMVLKWIGLR